jgi:hypothetical protein
MKKRLLKFLRNQKLAVIFGGLIFSLNVSAQDSSTNDGWINYSQKDGVKFSYKISECNNENVMFLKFENVQNYSKNVNFQLIIDGPNQDLPMPSLIHLIPNSVLEGQCIATPILKKHIETLTPIIHSFDMNVTQ